MRTRPTKERAESRIVARYHKLYAPLVELVQALQDLVPAGMELSDMVEFRKDDAIVQLAYAPRPVRVVVHTPDNTFTLQITEPTTAFEAQKSK